MKVPSVAGPPPSVPPAPVARVDAAQLPVTAVPPVAEVGGDPRAPFARAGVDVGALLATAGDTLVSRHTPSTAALSEVLERARAALVRGAAPDVLAALDQAWDGASRTEGGWYYRASALAALGRATEAGRVVQQGRAVRPNSAALLFLQSLLQHASGDGAGALTTQQSASALRDDAPLLTAWRAVLLAQLGDRRGAAVLLRTLADSGAPAALLEWARSAMAAPAGSAAATALAPPPAPTAGTGTALDQALKALGASIADGPAPGLREELQRLVRAMSVGGALHATARPEQLAAARSLLASLLAFSAAPALLPGSPRRASGLTGRPTPSALDALAGGDGVWRLTPAHGVARSPTAGGSEGGDAEALALPRGARAAWVAALFGGRLAEAKQALASMPAEESAAFVTVCRTLLLGAASARPASGTADTLLEVPDAGRAGAPETLGTWLDPLLTPVRLGLALLHFPSAHGEAVAALGSTPVRGRSARGRRNGADASQSHPPATGAAQVLLVGCLAGAVVATVSGAVVVALPLIAVAAWLGVARGADVSD